MTTFRRNPATMPGGVIIRDMPDPPSGLGCAIATNTHPRWDDVSNWVYGRDWYGWDGRPAGYVQLNNEGFGVGSRGIWWSSTLLGESGTLTYPYAFFLLANSNKARINYTLGHLRVSVRGVRDRQASELQDPTGTVYTDDYTDGSGNKYNGVLIGSKVWMTKNLQTTKYQKGGDISSEDIAIYPHSQVSGIANDTEMISAYGRLYGWDAVDNELIDDGYYHVPTKSEWEGLISTIVNINADIDEDIAAMVIKSCRQVNHPKDTSK